jgi:hypothetical protein
MGETKPGSLDCNHLTLGHFFGQIHQGMLAETLDDYFIV